jgi:hypothetical protein
LIKFTYPVSMFTAGNRPASNVRETRPRNPVQSIAPAALKGKSTAEIPNGKRHGLRIGIMESFLDPNITS